MTRALSGSAVSGGSDASLVLDDLLEDVANRLQAGDPVDCAAILARFPEHADSLRRLLPAIEVMAEFGVSASRLAEHGRPAAAERPPLELGLLGDFRILREVGRGGMGVVYEAEQVSLGRRVALKVLPFAAAMDPTQLRRFHNEALAAASLHHTHIVPVYSVGCERGAHYYAMQFIEGQTLAAIIGQRRLLDGLDRGTGNQSRAQSRDSRSANCAEADAGSQRNTGATSLSPGSSQRRELVRAAASLGIQAALALDHAHKLGIVHRDIKPANLLVDEQGDLWVTDFGLARLQGDPGLSITGDLMGTLRYMSPEAAAGGTRRGYVDHRTDIYSLGATLYELLTLRPAIRGCDRNEVLRQIANDEPASPRQLDPSIPRELETIVHKAMNKEPASRYATARELADDLTCFLEHRPIKARRPSVLERAAKAARRHRAAVVSAGVSVAVSLVLAVAGLALANLRIRSEKSRADTERARAQANLRRAQLVVDRMFTRAAEDLVSIPKTDEVRRVLFLEALEFYQSVIEETSTDPIVRHETARACLRLARIHRTPMVGVGQPGDAEPYLQQALALLTALVAEFPQEVAYREDLADAHALLGLTRFFDGRHDEAIAERTKELEIREQLAHEFPTIEQFGRRLVRAHVDIANVFMDAGRSPEAVAHDRQAEALWVKLKGPAPARIGEDLDDEAHLRHWLGRALFGSGQLAEAAPELAQAVALRQKLVSLAPGRADFQARLAHAQNDYALVLLENDDPERALALFQQAIAIHEALCADFPAVAEHPRRLGWVCAGLGDALWRLNRREEAEAAYRRSVDVRGKLVAERPGETSYRRVLAMAIYQLASFLRIAGRRDQASELFRRARDELDQAAAESPDDDRLADGLIDLLASCPDLAVRDPNRAVALARRAVARLPERAYNWSELGVALYRAGAWTEAIAALEKSQTLCSGPDPRSWFYLAMAHWQNGNRDEAARRLGQAREWMRKQRWLDPGLVEAEANVVELMNGSHQGSEHR